MERSSNVDDLWNENEKSVKTAVTEVLGFEERRTRKKWFNEQCKIASTEKGFARTKMLQYPSEENKRLLAIKQRNHKQMFRRKKSAWENSILEVDAEENLSTVEQRLDELTIEEVERAVDMLKSEEAPEKDAIVAELLKEGGK
ncbi:hypothetical protein QTP88_015525 [Uroleucon formosanum]